MTYSGIVLNYFWRLQKMLYICITPNIVNLG